VTNVIEVHGLTMSYGDIHAVRGIDLHVGDGEILAFLGPNGAGKTTTIEILEGFRTRSGGDVMVLGADPASAPRSWYEDIGIVLQETRPDGDLTARETVVQYAAYYSNPRGVDEVLEIVGLSEHQSRRADKLSGGQQRRLDLALAIIGDPKLVFLDEPTTGFDPSARREAWAMIESLRALGATVLLTTHYMDEAEHLADRIVVISDGEIVADGTKSHLVEEANLGTEVSWDATEVAASSVPGARLVDGRVHIATDDVAHVLGALVDASRESVSQLQSLRVAPPTLEDVYLHLIKTSAEAAS
jgi:ABC-2 type transport system ATP-binding protein